VNSYDGVPVADLVRRLHAPHLVAERTVSSALDLVHQLASDGAPAGTLVLAEEQVAGRGRQGRRWHSPPGVGIWLGWLVRPRARAGHGVTALRVGLALAETLETLGVQPRLKWPNDVLVDGRKLAGILCEARWHGDALGWVAVGVGVNVHGPLPEAVRDRAVALDDLLPDPTRVSVLERLVPRLQALRHDARLSGEERDRYHQYDWLLGRDLAEPAVGRARGIDDGGALLVETGHGVERIVGGSVVTA
jgi:BirA family biotin operon repressor/biotin-[acetyl-CoA-carboxylase] ligase